MAQARARVREPRWPKLLLPAAAGQRIEGALFPVRAASLGIPQVCLVIVPSHVTLEGQLAARRLAGARAVVPTPAAMKSEARAS